MTNHPDLAGETALITGDPWPSWWPIMPDDEPTPARPDAAPPSPPPVRLGRRAGLIVSAGVVAHTLWTSAAPAMAYRLYAEQFHLSHTATTGIFAIYPVFVVATLVGFGDLSDHIGRRATMLAGLAASLAGALLLAVAPNFWFLVAARAVMGIGVGLTAGPSTAAVAELGGGDAIGERAKRAALITTMAQAAGFAAGLLLGGALIEYAPWPTRLSFWMLAGLLTLLLVATLLVPRGIFDRVGAPTGGWRPRMPTVPRGARRPFAVAALAMMTAYSHGVLVLSLGGQVAHDLVGSSNALVSAEVLALFALMSGLVGMLARALPARPAMMLGALASTAGMGLLAAAVARQDLLLFLLSTVIAGAGYSLLFLSALEVINAAAPSRQRGGLLSALYLTAYLSMGVVALVLGTVATADGLGRAVDLGALAISCLGLATLALTVSMRGPAAPCSVRSSQAA